MKDFIIYIDGSSKRNTDKSTKRYRRLSGCGVVILDTNKNIILEKSIGFENSISTRMEIMAAIVALNEIKPGSNITIFSDNKTLVDAKNDKYIPKTNLDLWNKLNILEKGKSVNYIYVKGHGEDEFNILADKLAVNAPNICLLKEKDYLKSI